MAYQVLARKWRPQTFEAVVGQDAITRTLRNALLGSRIAHAYLFAGPRGVGKTTTARLLAKALLCPSRQGAEPCGVCPACQELTVGAAVDVIEIDGASNRKIDDVRTLRENVKYAPVRGRYKVYIIDEVHQLTPEAFDALLKTLEEPPAHVVFILATTDPRELPPTILSRVQRFDFRPIPPETLAASLDRILTEEGIAFDPGALPLIARAAQGSLRDALSLLDTVVAYGSGRVEAEAAAQILGMTAPEQTRRFAAALLGRDAAAALAAIDGAFADGEDMAALARETIELLRLLLILKAAPAATVGDLTPAETNELRALAEPASLDEILYLLRAFLEADGAMRESPHPRVELEIAAVRATRRPVPTAVDEILQKIEEAETRLRKLAWTAPPTPHPTAQEGLFGGSGSEPEPARRPPERRPPPTAPAPRATTPVAAPEGAPVANPLVEGWARVVEEVTRAKPVLGAVVAQATPTDLNDGRLTIRLDGNHFHHEMLADRASREVVTQAVRRHVAGATRVEVVSAATTPGGVHQHPAVQAAVGQFSGEVVAVRPRTPGGEDQ